MRKKRQYGVTLKEAIPLEARVSQLVNQLFRRFCFLHLELEGCTHKTKDALAMDPVVVPVRLRVG